MTHGERGRVALIPKPLTGIDIRSLPIGPMEAFVLSRVDGRTEEAEIALATGLPVEQVENILRRLADLGAIVSGGDAEAPKSGTKHAPPPSHTGSASGISGTQMRAPAVVIRSAPEPPPYDAKELEESADLDQERKHLILSTYYRLEKVSHYELLKVPSAADKKQVKKAYFDVVAVFHPDKYFGKNLGSFKPKLEKIFQRVTEAHDTLTRAKAKAEYDKYLESQQATNAFDIAAEDVATARAEEIQREIEREAQLLSGPESGPPISVRSSSMPPVTTGPSLYPDPRIGSMPPGPMEQRTPSPEERRRALARKLGGSIPPGDRPSATNLAAVTVKEAAGDALKRRYEARLSELKNDRVNRYVDQANEAIAAGNKVAATNALRIAVSLAPDDTALQARFEEVERQASAALADQYLEQARYEERRGQFADAAAAYERVLRGRPTAGTYERAAHCLLEARGDPRKACEYARKAVELAPADIGHKVTLARAYARAGMEQSALGELERARAISPNDDTIKEWIKRVKRGEVQ